MKTYMDKEVLIDFLTSEPGDHDGEDKQANWLGLKRFLRKQADLFLNVNLNKEGANPSSAFMTIMNSFGYAGTKIKCDPNKFRFKSKIDFQKEFSNPDNLFFINEVEEDQSKKWKSRNGFYLASSGELMEAWRKLNLSYGLPKSLPVRDFEVPCNIKNWETLLPYQHPVTDVVISDRFILKDKELFEANFVPLLKSLLSISIAGFNLTLFTSKKEVFEKDIQAMQLYLQALLLNAGFNCTFILVYDTIEVFKEHDRHIITNYYHINSGDTFTFFTKGGNLKTKGTTLDIKPLVDKDYFTVAYSVLKNLKRAYDHKNIEKTDGAINRLLSFIEQ